MKITFTQQSLLVLANMALGTAAMAGSMGAPVYSHSKHAEPTRHFTGFSITGAVGGIKGDMDLDQAIQFFAVDFFGNLTVESSFYDSSLTETGVAGMVALEYDYQFSSGLVLGLAVTAGFDYLTLKNKEYFADTVTFSALIEGVPFAGSNTDSYTSTFKTELKNDFALLFKPGFVVRQNTLLYALVGARWGNFVTKLNNTAQSQATILYILEGSPFPFQLEKDVVVSPSSSESEYHAGFTAGAGIQQAVSDHFRIGLEYAFTHYGNLEGLGVFASRKSIVQLESKVRITDTVDDYTFVTNTVMATVSYKF